MQSNERVAEMLVVLMSGKTIEIKTMLKKYGVSKRTYQRDIACIRNALIETNLGKLQEHAGTYRLVSERVVANYEQMLVVSHILLGSRALTTDELIVTLQRLAAGLPPTMRDELHKNLTLAKGSYTPLSKPVPLLKRVHQMTIYINANQKLVFVYRNSNPHVTKPQVHHAQPVAVFFEQHYFYVGMLSEEHHGYWLYRLDRIIEILSVQSGQKLDYAHRFSLQDHRHQSYLLDSGSLTPIRFIYRYALQTALDYFPTAKVLETKEDGSHIIEAYVKVDGAMLWLLSQGTGVQILSPLSLVNRMKTALMKTLEQYR